MDRTYLVAFGCILWGAMTAGIGLSQTLTQVRPLRCRQMSAKFPGSAFHAGARIGFKDHAVSHVSMVQHWSTPS